MMSCMNEIVNDVEITWKERVLKAGSKELVMRMLRLKKKSMN